MSFKIEYFDNVPFKGTCILRDNQLTTSTNHTLTFPSNGGTLATTDQIPTVPDLSGYATKTGTETLENKTLTTPTIASFKNGSFTITAPSKTGTIALTSDIEAASDLSAYATKDGTETLTNKTLTSPTISTIKNGNYTLTLPSKTATLATTSDGYLTSHQSLDSCVKTSGNQTVAGIKTFSSAPKLSTNTLTNSSGNTITLPSSAGTLALTSALHSHNITTQTIYPTVNTDKVDNSQPIIIKTVIIGSIKLVQVVVNLKVDVFNEELPSSAITPSGAVPSPPCALKQTTYGGTTGDYVSITTNGTVCASSTNTLFHLAGSAYFLYLSTA